MFVVWRLALACFLACFPLLVADICGDPEPGLLNLTCTGSNCSQKYFCDSLARCQRVLLVAASVSCEGRHAVLSRELRRGLELWAAQVNAPTASVRGFWGERLLVHLWFVDDRSEADEVKRIYRDFVSRQGLERPDALVGPFSTELSEVAAEASAGSDLLLLLPGAASPSIFRMGFDHIIGLLVSSDSYMVDAMRRTQALSATTAVFANADGEFPKSVCAGGAAEAHRLGMSVLGNFTWSSSDITLIVQQIKTLQPDVLVGCGYVSDASMFVVASMALDFNPKALVLTQASHPDLIGSVEARNANFIAGPALWVPELGDDICSRVCPIFANGSHFSSVYTVAYGRPPPYQAAAAAAAGILLIDAVSQSETYYPSKLRQKILDTGFLSTFYGRLAFTGSGMMDDDALVSRTVQLKPLAASELPFKRYNSSLLTVLGKGGQEMEEMPSWDAKRLLVYPCDEGHALRFRECVPCDAGRYRHSATTSCHPCERGTYAAVQAQAHCRPCPTGANCTELGTALPEASAGYYRMPLRSGVDLTPWNFQKCRPASICLGANTCLGSNTGTLCEQCQDGFTNQRSIVFGAGRGRCQECPATEINVALVILLILACTAYISIVFKATISSALSVRHLQSIILKIVINYLVFAQVTLQSTGFWDQMWTELQKSFPSAPTDEGPILLSYDCLLQSSGWHVFRAQMYLAIFMLPAALFCNMLFCLLRNVILICRIKRNKEIVERLRQFDDHSWNWTSLTRHFSENELVTTGKGSKSSSKLSLAASEAASQASAASAGLASLRDTEDEIKQWKEFKLAVVQSSVVWAFVLYPTIIQALLKGTMCEEYDTLRLMVNMDVVCFGTEHTHVFVLCLSGLLIYGLGIPAVFFLLLYRRRHKLMMPSTRRKLGFLYNGFQWQSYHYECIYMLRKFSILFAASLPQQTLRSTIMLCLGMYFFIQHLRLDPFDNREYKVLDKLELLNLWCLVVTLLGVSLFEETQSEAGKTSLVATLLSSVVFRACVIAIVIASHLVFWFYALRALVSDMVVRPLRLKILAGMKLQWWQEVLLAFYRNCVGSGNLVQFCSKDNSLDVSELTNRERRFLTVALQSTLECYMNFSGQATPGLVSVALREAVLICQRTRRLQIDWLRRHMEIDVPFMAVIWGAVRVRLYGAYAGLSARCKRFWTSPSPKDTDDPEEDSPVPKKQVSLLRMPITRWDTHYMQNIADREKQPTVDEFFVEELHDALMVLWPEIKRGWPELHNIAAQGYGCAQRRFVVWEGQGAEAIMSEMQSPAGGNVLLERALCRRSSKDTLHTFKTGTATPKASERAPSEGTDDGSGNEDASKAEQGWLHQMLDAGDTETELSRMSAALQRSNRRSFCFACLVILQRRRTWKVQQQLEEALDKLAISSSLAQGVIKPMHRSVQRHSVDEACFPQANSTDSRNRNASKASTTSVLDHDIPKTSTLERCDYVEEEVVSPASSKKEQQQKEIHQIPQLQLNAAKAASALTSDVKAERPAPGPAAGPREPQPSESQSGDSIFGPWAGSLVRALERLKPTETAPVAPKASAAAAAAARLAGPSSGPGPSAFSSAPEGQRWLGALRPASDLKPVQADQEMRDPAANLAPNARGEGSQRTTVEFASTDRPSSWRKRVEGRSGRPG